MQGGIFGWTMTWVNDFAVYLLTVLLPRRFSSATFETEVIACL